MRVLKNNVVPILISFLIVGLAFTVLFMMKGFVLQLIGAALIIVGVIFCIFCGLYMLGYILLGGIGIGIGIVAPLIGILIIIGIFI
jgi:hypothetical protein